MNEGDGMTSGERKDTQQGVSDEEKKRGHIRMRKEDNSQED